MKIERLPMQHTYDAGTWVAHTEYGKLLVERDGMEDQIVYITEQFQDSAPRMLSLTLDEARALVQMLTEALDAVKEEE